MDEPAQASPQSRGCGIQSLVFTSLPAVLGMRYSELGVFASETVEEPRGMGRAALSLALNVSHWEVVGQRFFFPPSSSKLRIFLEFLKILA